MFSSSALQYLDGPDDVLQRLLELKAPVVVWSRLAMTDGPAIREIQHSRLVDNGPGPLPPGFEDREVQYQITHLPERRFLAARTDYQLKLRSGPLSSAAFIFVRNDIEIQ